MSDLISRAEALNAIVLGDTVTRLAAKINAIPAALDAQAGVTVKPLVWVKNADSHTYTSTQGGFTVKIGGNRGWEWTRGHIFGFADSRQGAFDAANERHTYDIGCFLKPVTHAELLAAAEQLPEVKALVDAAKSYRDGLEQALTSRGYEGESSMDDYSDEDAALAPFTRKGE